MEVYIWDYLTIGVIRPSSLPVGRVFSLWEESMDRCSSA